MQINELQVVGPPLNAVTALNAGTPLNSGFCIFNLFVNLG